MSGYTPSANVAAALLAISKQAFVAALLPPELRPPLVVKIGHMSLSELGEFAALLEEGRTSMALSAPTAAAVLERLTDQIQAEVQRRIQAAP